MGKLLINYVGEKKKERVTRPSIFNTLILIAQEAR